MHRQTSPDSVTDDPGRQLDAIEAAVFEHVLAEHPTHFTTDELILTLSSPTFPAANAIGIADAIAHLTHDGLVREHGACIAPTMPAVRAHWLLIDRP